MIVEQHEVHIASFLELCGALSVGPESGGETQSFIPVDFSVHKVYILQSICELFFLPWLLIFFQG